MTTAVPDQPYNRGERAVLLIARALSATLLTALIGTVGNWIYERFFAPELYAVGPPLARAIFVAGWSALFIFVGLLILGLPAAYLLRRNRAESAISYLVIGSLLGAFYGFVLGASPPWGHIVCGMYGGTCAMFWWWLPRRS